MLTIRGFRYDESSGEMQSIESSNIPVSACTKLPLTNQEAGASICHRQGVNTPVTPHVSEPQTWNLEVQVLSEYFSRLLLFPSKLLKPLSGQSEKIDNKVKYVFSINFTLFTISFCFHDRAPEISCLHRTHFDTSSGEPAPASSSSERLYTDSRTTTRRGRVAVRGSKGGDSYAEG
jgi:hypothetical protein